MPKATTSKAEPAKRPQRINVAAIKAAAQRREEIRDDEADLIPGPPAIPMAPPPPPAPEPPNPVVLALQEQILELVTRRGTFQAALIDSNKILREVAAQVEYNRERIQQAESEVQYRLQLIAQLKGDSGKDVIRYEPTQVNFNSLGGYGARLGYESGPTVLPGGGSSGASGTINFPTGAVGGAMGSIPAQRPIMPGMQGEVRSEDAEDIRRSM